MQMSYDRRDDDDYYEQRRQDEDMRYEERLADDAQRRATERYQDSFHKKNYRQTLDFEKLADFKNLKLKGRKHKQGKDSTEQSESEVKKEANNLYQKTVRKNNAFIDGGDDDEEEDDYTANVRSSRWIYRAYYNANNPRSFIGRWLRYLNHGYTTSAFDENKVNEKGQISKKVTDDMEQDDLDATVTRLKKKANGITNFAKILKYLCLAGVILIDPRFSVVTCLIGLALWLVCLVAMTLDVSYSTLAIKLSSRLRMGIRGKKQQKIVLSREEIVGEQYKRAEKMFSTLVDLCVDTSLIGVNLFIFPIIYQASALGHGYQSAGLIIDPKFLYNFLGSGLVAHIFLLCAPLVMGYTMKRELLDNMNMFKSAIHRNLDAHRYRVRPLHVLINGRRPSYEANITIGRSLITGDDVVLPVKDRANGTLIAGVNGAGKSGSIFKPWIAQDLTKLVQWYRALPKLLKEPNYFSNQIAAKYLNGIVVMDTTNDLCKDTFDLASKDLNLPREMIHYLNPGDEDSDTINLMRGPAQGVANMITSCLNALTDQKGGNDYFLKSQQEWLHEYILLVKEASTFIEVPVTFNDLFDVCLDTSEVDRYLELLDVYEEILRKARTLYYLYTRKHLDLRVKVNADAEEDVERYRESGSDAFKYAMKLAENEDDLAYHQAYDNKLALLDNDDLNRQIMMKRFISKEQLISNLIVYDHPVNTPRLSRDLSLPFTEIANEYSIVHTNNTWFKGNVVKLHDVPDVAANGNEKQSADQKVIESYKKNNFTAHKKGNWVYFDQQESSVKGMRVILSNLASNQFVRRIFFNEKEGDNFSIDSFFHVGGLLLMYTGKGESGLSPENTRVIAAIMQNLIISASQRRKVDNGSAAEPLIPLYFDEHIDYMTEEFVKFTGQVRKYNVSVLSIVQSYHQVANEFGKEFLGTLLSTMRSKGAFGDAEAEDAAYMSKMFGTHPEFTKQYQSTQVQGPHNDRVSLRGKFEEVPNITPEQIMNMQPYTLAVRFDVQNEPVPYDHVQVSQVNHKKMRQSRFRIKNNKEDQAAKAAYLSTFEAANPDFDGISLILHEYFLRVKKYYDNGQHDVYQDVDNDIDINHQTDTVQNNIQNTLAYAQDFGVDMQSLPSFEITHREDTYVKGVPDWIFEEFRDHIFEKSEEDEPIIEPKGKNHGGKPAGKGVDVTGSSWDHGNNPDNAIKADAIDGAEEVDLNDAVEIDGDGNVSANDSETQSVEEPEISEEDKAQADAAEAAFEPDNDESSSDEDATGEGSDVEPSLPGVKDMVTNLGNARKQSKQETKANTKENKEEDDPLADALTSEASDFDEIVEVEEDDNDDEEE